MAATLKVTGRTFTLLTSTAIDTRGLLSLVNALDEHIARLEPFTVEELLPYGNRTALSKALQRRKIMR